VPTMPESPKFSNCDHGKNRPPASGAAMPRKAVAPPYCIIKTSPSTCNARGKQECFQTTTPETLTAAARLLEDMELGLGSSHHMASVDARATNHKKTRAHPRNGTRQVAKQIKKGARDVTYCAGVAREGWRRPRRGAGTRRCAAPPCNCATSTSPRAARDGQRKATRR
jgi:hypothetical protein